MGVFSRMRVTCGGVILEDISEYNRLHTMMHMLKVSPDRDKNDNIEGFGNNETLANGASRTCCFTPLSGILYQKKYLPIRYCPLLFELSLIHI